MSTPSAHFTPQAREDAILMLLPMTRRMARGMTKFARNADFEDCLHDGCIGIIRAVDSYDPARGIPLARYARTIIMGAIFNGIRARDPVSDVARREMRRAEERRLALAQQLGRLPSLREMEEHEPQLRSTHLVVLRADTLSLDQTLRDGENDPGDWSEDPAEIVTEKHERRNVAASVQAAVAALPPQQREVVSKIYFRGYTSTAVAKEWGRTPQRITQIRGAAEAALRQVLTPL